VTVHALKPIQPQDKSRELQAEGVFGVLKEDYEFHKWFQTKSIKISTIIGKNLDAFSSI